MAVRTSHIQHMLETARDMAENADLVMGDEIEYGGKRYTMDTFLARAANLAAHAAQELLDEAFTNAGMPVV